MNQTLRRPIADELSHDRAAVGRERNALAMLIALVAALFIGACSVPQRAHAAQTIEFANGGRAELADDGTITGTCQLTGGYIIPGDGYYGTVVLPDGTRLPAGCYETLVNVPNHGFYLGPCDGVYRFKATRRDNGYFIYVYSQDAAAPAPGALIPKPPAGYTYQHAYAEGWNPEIVTDVSFAKVSADAEFVTMNATYSVAGATYDIFEAETGAKVGSIVTGDDGQTSCKLVLGKRYYAVETSAPAGYVLNDARIEFTASADGGAVELADEPMRVDVEIRKTDSATGGPAQAGATLEGAVFKLVDARGKAQEATTDANGRARFSPIPLGAFSIVETRAPVGYKLDPTVHEYYVGPDAPHDGGTVSFVAESDFPDDVIAFDIELAKFKEDPNADESGLRWPAEGVQFQIISNTTGAALTTLTTDAYGFARTPEGAWYGAGARPSGVNGALPYDSKGYLVREVASTVPEGYERMDDFTIEADEQVDGVRLKYIIENKTPAARLQIVKTDALSGQTVPLAGFSFRLLDAAGKPVQQEAWYPNHVKLDTFKTDDTGGVTLPEQLVPGTYFIEEVAARPPYLLNGNPMKVTLGQEGGAVAIVRFADEQATGRAQLNKHDTETGDALAGASFDVVAQELIASPDGTIQAVAGEVVASVETGADGIAKVDGLALGDGSATYAFVETKAPDGYALDATPHVFEVTYEDSNTPVVETHVEVANAPTEIVVSKTDAGSGNPLEGVSFSVQPVASDSNGDGDEGGSEGELGPEPEPEPEPKRTFDLWKFLFGGGDDKTTGSITASTNAEGLATWKRLVPGDYVLLETETLPGYVRDNTVRRFSIDESGAVVGGDEGGRFELANDYTKVEISKRAIASEEELPGAQLALFDSADTLIERWISSGEPHLIERLEPGMYVLREERAPANYDAASEVEFVVEETGEIQRVIMYDTPIEIMGQIDKRQEIATPVAENTVANGDGSNRAEARPSNSGEFNYTLDWRNTSNTWVDEFTVTDTLPCVENGFAILDGLTTPVVEGDYDGFFNVWYITTLSDGSTTGDESTSATLSDGHNNPWLQDPAAFYELGEDGRALPFEGWKLWRADVPTDRSVELSVDELGLEADERVTGLRFEYGRVEEGFSTRPGGWDRNDLKDLHDDIDVMAVGAKSDNSKVVGSIKETEEEETGGALYTPAVLHMRATDEYRAEVPLHNYAQVDLFRNGGGEGLEDHDSDEVEQVAGDASKPIPVRPGGSMPQTGDWTRITFSLLTTAGVTTIAAGLSGRRRRRKLTNI